MIIKKITAFLLVLVLLISFTACSFSINNDEETNVKANDFPVVLNGLTISSKPSKVAVLSPSYADVIIALGYETSIILATPDCIQPEIEMLNKVEADDYQAFADAGVDLVICEELSDMALSAFNEFGIPVLSVERAKSRTDFERLYSQIGSALNGGETGANHGSTQAKSIMITLDDVSRLVPKTGTITTVAVLQDLTSKAITGSMIGDYVIESTGSINIFGAESDGIYDFAELAVANPTVIFCGIGTKETLINDARFAELSAVKNDRVYEINLDLVLFEGRSIILGATTMTGLLYPELLMTEEEKEAKEEAEKQEEETSEDETSSQEEVEATPSPLVVLDRHENYDLYTELQRGDSGEKVLELQKRLNILGYLLIEYDGTYSEATVMAVEEFQKNIEMTPTGVADPNTLAYLYDKGAITADGGILKTEETPDDTTSENSDTDSETSDENSDTSDENSDATSDNSDSSTQE